MANSYFLKKLSRKYTASELFGGFSLTAYQFVVCFAYEGKEYPIGLTMNYSEAKIDLLHKRGYRYGEPEFRDIITSNNWLAMYPGLATALQTLGLNKK